MGRVRSSIPRSRVPVHRLLRAQPGLARRWLLVVALAALSGRTVAHSVAAARAAERSWGRTRAVLVTTEPVVAGAPLTGSVEEVTWPDALLPDGALTDVPDRARAATSLARGTPLTPEALAGTGDDGVERTRVAVPAGPAPLPVDEGDRVDVWSTTAAGFTAAGTPGRARTDRVAEAAVVVAVDAVDATVVVAVLPDEAEAVARAVALTTVVLTGIGGP